MAGISNNVILKQQSGEQMLDDLRGLAAMAYGKWEGSGGGKGHMGILPDGRFIKFNTLSKESGEKSIANLRVRQRTLYTQMESSSNDLRTWMLDLLNRVESVEKFGMGGFRNDKLNPNASGLAEVKKDLRILRACLAGNKGLLDRTVVACAVSDMCEFLDKVMGSNVLKKAVWSDAEKMSAKLRSKGDTRENFRRIIGQQEAVRQVKMSAKWGDAQRAGQDGVARSLVSDVVEAGRKAVKNCRSTAHIGFPEETTDEGYAVRFGEKARLLSKEAYASILRYDQLQDLQAAIEAMVKKMIERHGDCGLKELFGYNAVQVRQVIDSASKTCVKYRDASGEQKVFRGIGRQQSLAIASDLRKHFLKQASRLDEIDVGRNANRASVQQVARGLCSRIVALIDREMDRPLAAPTRKELEERFVQAPGGLLEEEPSQEQLLELWRDSQALSLEIDGKPFWSECETTVPDIAPFLEELTRIADSEESAGGKETAAITLFKHSEWAAFFSETRQKHVVDAVKTLRGDELCVKLYKLFLEWKDNAGDHPRVKSGLDALLNALEEGNDKVFAWRLVEDLTRATYQQNYREEARAVLTSRASRMNLFTEKSLNDVLNAVSRNDPAKCRLALMDVISARLDSLADGNNIRPEDVSAERKRLRAVLDCAMQGGVKTKKDEKVLEHIAWGVAAKMGDYVRNLELFNEQELESLVKAKDEANGSTSWYSEVYRALMAKLVASNVRLAPGGLDGLKDKIVPSLIPEIVNRRAEDIVAGLEQLAKDGKPAEALCDSLKSAYDDLFPPSAFRDRETADRQRAVAQKRFEVIAAAVIGGKHRQDWVPLLGEVFSATAGICADADTISQEWRCSVATALNEIAEAFPDGAGTVGVPWRLTSHEEYVVSAADVFASRQTLNRLVGAQGGEENKQMVIAGTLLESRKQHQLPCEDGFDLIHDYKCIQAVAKKIAQDPDWLSTFVAEETQNVWSAAMDVGSSSKRITRIAESLETLVTWMLGSEAAGECVGEVDEIAWKLSNPSDRLAFQEGVDRALELFRSCKERLAADPQLAAQCENVIRSFEERLDMESLTEQERGDFQVLRYERSGADYLRTQFETGFSSLQGAPSLTSALTRVPEIAKRLSVGGAAFDAAVNELRRCFDACAEALGETADKERCEARFNAFIDALVRKHRACLDARKAVEEAEVRWNEEHGYETRFASGIGMDSVCAERTYALLGRGKFGDPKFSDFVKTAGSCASDYRIVTRVQAAKNVGDVDLDAVKAHAHERMPIIVRNGDVTSSAQFVHELDPEAVIFVQNPGDSNFMFGTIGDAGMDEAIGRNSSQGAPGAFIAQGIVKPVITTVGDLQDRKRLAWVRGRNRLAHVRPSRGAMYANTFISVDKKTLQPESRIPYEILFNSAPSFGGFTGANSDFAGSLDWACQNYERITGRRPSGYQIDNLIENMSEVFRDKSIHNGRGTATMENVLMLAMFSDEVNMFGDKKKAMEKLNALLAGDDWGMHLDQAKRNYMATFERGIRSWFEGMLARAGGKKIYLVATQIGCGVYGNRNEDVAQLYVRVLADKKFKDITYVYSVFNPSSSRSQDQREIWVDDNLENVGSNVSHAILVETNPALDALGAEGDIGGGVSVPAETVRDEVYQQMKSAFDDEPAETKPENERSSYALMFNLISKKLAFLKEADDEVKKAYVRLLRDVNILLFREPNVAKLREVISRKVRAGLPEALSVRILAALDVIRRD